MRTLAYVFAVIVGLVIIVTGSLAAAAWFAWPKLPSLENLTDYHPRIPLRVYTADGVQIGEFGEERRTFTPIAKAPDLLKHAILAAEDDRFFEHGGLDYAGFARAAIATLTSGGKRSQGASTITMQVARNFFLSREKTLSRKFYEILLTLKIEKNLNKEQILELYFNQIFLGQRAYGFTAAAQTYFGKSLEQLSAAEAAMLAGLPKAPSAYNPVSNPKRAALRQQYVLRRMSELGYLDAEKYALALKEPLVLARSPAGSLGPSFSVHAEYVAEMARQIAVEQFKDAAYTAGIRVITTLSAADQEAAYISVRRGLLDYDRRHAFRGAEAYVDMSGIASNTDENLELLLEDFVDNGEMQPAIVLNASTKAVKLYRRGGELIDLGKESLRFVAAMAAENAPPAKRLKRGAIVRIAKSGKLWEVVQQPEVEGALLAVDPRDGAVRALVGGFDFYRNKFNHVTQAWRQPGSSFKPFIYSAALEKGFGPSSVVDDAPISFSALQTGSKAWEPKNYDGRYEGPMSLRTALAKSKNMVSIRMLDAISPQYAQDYVTRFGFEAERHPAYLTMALGAGSVTLWQMGQAYAVFANGGYRINPYIVQEIRDEQGKVLARTPAVQAGQDAPRVLDPRNAFLMDSMMRDVVRRGTATKAMSLKRGDLAGKTGTTNDYVDAWFCGYQPTLVAVSWIGYDQPRNLGSGETGGAASLPMWINFMAKALKGVPEAAPTLPSGLLAVTTQDGRSDYIYEERLGVPPEGDAASELSADQSEPAAEPEAPSQNPNNFFTPPPGM